MKAQHPIRKLQEAVYLNDISRRDVERKISRHVRPLLDALEQLHSALRHSYNHPEGDCDYCRLLTRWRAKL